MSDDRIVAVGLLTHSDVSRLGATFDRLWPVEDAGNFGSLLQAIDEADRAIRQSRPSRDGDESFR
jgi:hypothetical protein